MQRRDFLTLAAFFPALAGAHAEGVELEAKHTPSDLRASILQVAQSLPASHALVTLWQTSHLPPLAGLLTELAQGLPSNASPLNTRALLTAQIRQDFCSGNTRNLHGWILADTELKLCAIACLAGSPEQASV